MEQVQQVSSDGSIECLDLGMRAYNLLRRHGISSVSDLYKAVKNDQLRLIKGLGPLLHQDIINKLDGILIVDSGEIRKILEQRTTNAADEKNVLDEQEKIDVLVNTINEVVIWQKSTVQKEIAAKLLHENVIIGGMLTKHWLKNQDVNFYHLFKVYAGLLGTTCITEELAHLMEKASPRDINIFIDRYGYSPKTYEQIGDSLSVTRERIRQILNRVSQQIIGKVKISLQTKLDFGSNPPLARIQTGLLLAKQIGFDITFDIWVDSLTNSGLLGHWQIGKDFSGNPIELMVSICNLLSQEGFHEFSIPDNLEYAIHLALVESPNIPARNLQIIKSLPKKIRKEIRRHTYFSGGVQSRWLSGEINYELKQVEEILLALGYKSTKNDWFVPGKVDIREELSKIDVLDHSLRKMTQYCGPLNIENICAGMRHAVSRTRYPVPPPEVMKVILNSRGYMVEENLYYWNGRIDEELSRGEEIILECLGNYGSVVHHAEIAQAFIDSELSFASLHATLNRTPIIEKIDSALYKLRGANVAISEIERAKNVGEKIPVDLEVRFDRTGKIIVEATLGILAVGTGVIFTENLPNLAGEWHCIINEQSFDNVIVTENEIRRLLNPFEYLQCEITDRIIFSFDTWSRTVSLEKV